MSKFNYTTTIMYFSYFMVVVYFCIGIFLLVSKQVGDINLVQQKALGVLCLAYGLFRGYRIYKSIKKNNDEE